MFDEIARATGQHIVIVAIAMVVATAVGVPLGVVCVRYTRLGKVTLRLIDIIQTIPSLALFGFLIPVPFIGGIGIRAAIVGLILFFFLPNLRHTRTGLDRLHPLIPRAGLVVVVS